jgi:lysyl-tRNA synthetase class 1
MADERTAARQQGVAGGQCGCRAGRATPPANASWPQTGYGPSAAAHRYVCRGVPPLVRQAFARLSDLPTWLFAFSDDMDGLRAIPDNIPNAEMVARHPINC